jgi:hypothetical protein
MISEPEMNWEPGRAKSDLNELEEAVNADGPAHGKKLGKRVSAWVGNATTRILSGAWKVAASVATSELPKQIEHYYNLPK